MRTLSITSSSLPLYTQIHTSLSGTIIYPDTHQSVLELYYCIPRHIPVCLVLLYTQMHTRLSCAIVYPNVCQSVLCYCIPGCAPVCLVLLYTQMRTSLSFTIVYPDAHQSVFYYCIPSRASISTLMRSLGLSATTFRGSQGSFKGPSLV